MGNSAGNNTNQKSLLHYSGQFQRSYDNSTKQQLIKRYINIMNQEESVSIDQKLKKKSEIWKHPNLTAIKSWNKYNIQNNYCSFNYRYEIIYSCSHWSLAAQLQNRTSVLSIDHIIKIYQRVVKGLAHLQRNDISHNALRLETILIKQNGNIEVADPTIENFKNNFESFLLGQSNIYLSPEILELVPSRKLINVDLIKSDVFIFGMILLELTSGRQLYIKQKELLIDWRMIGQIIQQIKKKSQYLANILKQMLLINPLKRSDWINQQNNLNRGYRSQIVQDIQIAFIVSSNVILPQFRQKVCGIYIQKSETDYEQDKQYPEQDYHVDE